MENVKTFNELNNVVKNHSWSEIYSDPNLGREIGEAVIFLIKSDNFHVITHNGLYHTDDSMAAAVLSLALNHQVRVTRSRDPQVLNKVFTFDVGGESFDHHNSNDLRVEGDPKTILSSIGKVWLTVGRCLSLSEKNWRMIDESLIQPIDLTDNTGQINPLNFLLNGCRPTWKDQSPYSMDDSYNRSVRHFIEMIGALVHQYRSSDEAECRFRAAVDKTAEYNGKCVNLNRWMPMDYDYTRTKNIHLISWNDQNKEGYSMIRTVGSPTTQDWSIPQDLKDKVDGVTFIHKGGFICEVETSHLADAIDYIVYANASK